MDVDSNTNNANKADIKPSKNQYMPWVEKYRPKKISEIAHQSHVVSTLRNTMNTSNLTHLLFYGPPGTGKTSTILALARQLYGPTLMKRRVLELNASDERGINVVRVKIKSFAQFAINHSYSEPGYPCPPYKLIILDEADSMTRDAQTALRRTMERYSNVTRFCLICNYVSRIIAPVASRCSKFRFELLTMDPMFAKLKTIAECENLKMMDDVIRLICEMSDGDMRKAITLLQTSSLMKCGDELISKKDVLTVTVTIPDSIISDHLICACQSGNANEINKVSRHVMCEGYPVQLIFQKLLQFVIVSDLFLNIAKSKIAMQIAISDKCLVDGASEYLQLLCVLFCIQTNITAEKRSNNNDIDID